MFELRDQAEQKSQQEPQLPKPGSMHIQQDPGPFHWNENSLLVFSFHFIKVIYCLKIIIISLV